MSISSISTASQWQAKKVALKIHHCGYVGKLYPQASENSVQMAAGTWGCHYEDGWNRQYQDSKALSHTLLWWRTRIYHPQDGPRKERSEIFYARHVPALKPTDLAQVSRFIRAVGSGHCQILRRTISWCPEILGGRPVLMDNRQLRYAL